MKALKGLSSFILDFTDKTKKCLSKWRSEFSHKKNKGKFNLIKIDFIQQTLTNPVYCACLALKTNQTISLQSENLNGKPNFANKIQTNSFPSTSNRIKRKIKLKIIKKLKKLDRIFEAARNFFVI